jgi:uncharacterized Zn finger protein (UPF0148 family)
MKSKDAGFSFCAVCDGLPEGRSAWDPSTATREETRTDDEGALEAEIEAVQRRLRGDARGIYSSYLGFDGLERVLTRGFTGEPRPDEEPEHSDEEPANEPPVSYDRTAAREQSDRASRLIGQKMLQGYALLGEVCPNESCIGIPLIRSRQRVKECVICGQTWSEAGNAAGNVTETNERTADSGPSISDPVVLQHPATIPAPAQPATQIPAPTSLPLSPSKRALDTMAATAIQVSLSLEWHGSWKPPTLFSRSLTLNAPVLSSLCLNSLLLSCVRQLVWDPRHWKRQRRRWRDTLLRSRAD